jgi:Domain of unknown function (DUF222)/HNH endonuclease
MTELTTLDSVSAAADGPPLEWLERQICDLAGHLAAATCRFVVLLGDFDAREGWRAWDLPSCSAWLSWKCQMSAGTAREHARVARAMRTLPVISGEFAAGRMSFAKVRALTRIATPATDADLAEMASPMTANQLERFARAHRHVSKLEADTAEAERRLRWRVDDDGSLQLSIRLPPADGAVVLQALRASARSLESAGESPAPGQPRDRDAEEAAARTSLADALVDISGAYLAGKIATASNPDIYQVIVHVGTDVLTETPDVSAETPAEARDVSAETRSVPSLEGLVGHPANPRRCHVEDGPALHPAAVRRMACQATLSWMLHDHDGTLLDVGRRHRVPPPALRRAVRERDCYRCRFPGCRSRRVEIHHLQPWSEGGPTSLRNLILLCKCHHTFAHELGYLITLGADGEITVTRPDGSDLPSSPQLESSGADIADCHDAGITPDTIVAYGYGDRLNLDLAIWASFANASLRAAPE